MTEAIIRKQQTAARPLKSLSTWTHLSFTCVSVCAPWTSLKWLKNQEIFVWINYKEKQARPKAASMWDDLCALLVWERRCPNQRVQSEGALSPQQSEIAAIHLSIALSWLPWWGQAAWQFLPRLSSPHPAPHPPICPKTTQNPRFSLAPGLTCGGGKETETQETQKTAKPWGTCKLFPSPPPVDSEAHAAVRADKLSICRSGLMIHVFDSLIKLLQRQLHRRPLCYNTLWVQAVPAGVKLVCSPPVPHSPLPLLLSHTHIRTGTLFISANLISFCGEKKINENQKVTT